MPLPPGGVNPGGPSIDPAGPRAPDNYTFISGSRAFGGYIGTGLLVAQHTAAGIIPVFQAASGGGDSYVNTGQQTLWIHNNGPLPVTVTIKAQNKCNVGPGFLHDIVTVIAAAGEGTMGPAAFNIYNDAAGLVQISYTTVVGVTVALTAA